MNLIVVEAIRGRCASFTVLTSTVSEIFCGQTTPSSSIDIVQGASMTKNKHCDRAPLLLYFIHLLLRYDMI